MPAKIELPKDLKQFERDCKTMRYQQLSAHYGASWTTIKNWKKKLGLTNGKKQDREITWNVIKDGRLAGCWICTSHKPDYHGYPQGNANKGRSVIAKITWSDKNGLPWPVGSFCLHSCDNPMCINPDHVRPGSPRENQGEMAERDRSPWGDRSGARKLNSEQARMIYELRDSGRTMRDVAKEFGVSGANVWHIWHEKTWWRDNQGIENFSEFLTTGEKVKQ